MSEFNVDMEQIEDFADVSLADANEYQDQTGPAPLAPGAFRLRVEEGGLRKDASGELILDKGYPQVQLNKLTVVEPEEFKDKVIYPFQNYSLKPVTGGNRKGSVPLVDLLRGFDDKLTFASGKEAIQLLVEQIAEGNTFIASTNWIAKDSEAIKSYLDENGGNLDDVDAKDKQTFFNSAIIRGQKRFPKDGNGGFIPEIEGPSGDVLQARVSLTRIYPSSVEVGGKTLKKLGPFGKKGEKAAA